MTNSHRTTCLLFVFAGVLLLTGTGFGSVPAHKHKKAHQVNRTVVRDPVFSPDYIKTVLLKATKWQLDHPKHSPTDWTNGAFYAGVFAAYETTGSPLILDLLMAIGERNQWRPGKRFDHADDIAVSQTYIDLYRIKKDRRMIQPTIDTVQKMLSVTGPEFAKHGLT